MQLKYLLVASAFFLFSCSSGTSEKEEPANLSEDQGQEALEGFFTEKDFPLEWKLASYSTMMAGSYATGEDMPYREKLIFTEDGTFRKIREESGKTLEATGEYLPVTQNGERYYQLNYASNNKLIENCNGSLEEMFQLLSGQKAQGTAQACDYPAKTYELSQ